MDWIDVGIHAVGVICGFGAGVVVGSWIMKRAAMKILQDLEKRS